MECAPHVDTTQGFPACLALLPAYTEGRKATFYLAAEEYIANNLPADNYFFTWQIAPTVVMGRNQVFFKEINYEFCTAHHIDVVRRKSGGGCIFADMGNIMLSLITPPRKVEDLFQEYAQAVADTLGQLGADMEVTGRNDVVLKGFGKVCGNAFYRMPSGKNIVHGTMLYDTDYQLMSGALNPEYDKLKAQGVESVRSRVGLLKEVLDMDVTTLRRQLCSLLTNRVVQLTDEDVVRIEQIELGYRQPDYLYGGRQQTDISFSERIEGCGTLGICLTLKGNIISDVALTGDFFEVDNAAQAFAGALVGVEFSKEQMRQALCSHQPWTAVRNLTPEALLALLRL